MSPNDPAPGSSGPPAWRRARRAVLPRLALAVALAVGLVLVWELGPGREPPPAPAAGSGQALSEGPAPGGLDDAAFEIPPFQPTPAFESVEREKDWTLWRAGITYRKSKGREVGPWTCFIYLPAGPQTPQPDPPAGRPLVIVLPLGGETSRLDAFFAKRFARRGFAVLVLKAIPREADEGVMHSLRGTATTFTEDTANLVRIVDWARGLRGIDAGRIGLFGASRGAIDAALAAQIVPGLSAVLVLGGADLPGLLRDSHLGVVERLRGNELERAGGDMAQAAARAAAILQNVDPASRPGRLDPARTLLVNARSDRVIPRKQALALRDAAGGASQYWLPLGHNTTILFAFRIRALALEHFEKTLGGGGLR